MRNRLLATSLVASLLLFGVPLAANVAVASSCDDTLTNYPSSTNSPGFGGGLGTVGSPWQICSPEQLAGIGANAATRGAHYVLKADIDLTGEDWSPIGPIFSGVFDGEYRVISNAVVDGNPNNGGTHPFALSSDAASDAGTDLYGLFAMVSGTVQKLELRNFDINSETDATTALDSAGFPTYSYQSRFPMSGVVAGACLSGGKLYEIRISDSQVRGKNSAAGLLAGDSQGCVADLIDASDAENSVSTQWAIDRRPDVGGLIGSGPSLTLSRAVFGGSVGDPNFNPAAFGETGTMLGGIIGYLTSSGSSLDQIVVTSTARVRGSVVSDDIGGIAGRIEAQKFTYAIRNSIFAGQITIPHSDASHTGRIGGLYALCGSGCTSQVLNSLNVGTMPQSTTRLLGPIAGAFTGPVSGTFYDATTLSTFIDANEVGEGKLTTELGTINTFSAASWSIAQSGSSDVSSPTWSLSSYNPTTQVWSGTAKIWRISEGSYPRLVWQDFWPLRAGAPSSVTAASSSAGVADLTWSASTQAGFDPVTGYKIELSTDSGSTWSVAIENTANLNTAAAITGLSAGSSYLFRVAGRSTAGVGVATTTSSSLQMGSNPASPQNLSAVRLTENSFRISWDPPSNTGGLSISSYTLQVDRGSGFETVAHTGTSAEITGVSINSLWSFRVLATNVVGSSSYAVYTNTPPVPYSGPIVTSFSTREVIAGRSQSVTLEGVRLSQVTELFIGTSKLSFTRSVTDQLLVSLPAMAKGVYDLRMVYTGGGVITHQAAFTVADALLALPTRTLIFANFAGDGFRLPAVAARGIRSAVSSIGSASTILCVGSTSGRRATAADKRLALRRAQEACNLAKRLVPGVVTEVRANPASGLGARFRNVTLTILGN